MTGPRSITARAHAKVNLALAVGPPRPASPFAGYHPIASWMHAVSLADDLELTQAPTTAYDLAWSDARPVEWAPEQDLAARAHRALEALVGRPLPVRLRLRKSIPAGGGLGGGSADAAATLLALRDLFTLDVTDTALTACAHALGTDIPFFLDPDSWRQSLPPRPALVTGLGDHTARLTRRTGFLTLFCPPFGCPTGAVYKAFDAAPTAACDEPRVRALTLAPTIDPHALFNDLALAAERAEPRLADTRRALAAALDTPVHVSGSGSTLFALIHSVPVGTPGVRAIPAELI